jgi:4-hydroxyacetophenone monooxygenase
MALNVAELDQALNEAHIPSLMMALVHLTGDAGLIERVPRPVYDFFGDGQGGIPDDIQAEVRAKVKAAMIALDAGAPLPPPPPAATIRKMMDFIAGVDIPERYAPFLMEELAIDGVDAKRPVWEGPKAKANAGKLKVVIVGAGMSGILMGIRLSQAGVPFEIIEKNPDVGGTWFENTYPGCRVDNPNHLYSFSFEDNHDWPYHYSTQPVLLAYFQRTADKYGLRKHIRFETEVEEARWDEKASLWRVAIKGPGGKTETLSANAVVSAVGQLNQPRIPDIEGRDSFAGTAFHSARWPKGLDVTGKRVACIGTGASAFQFVPEVAKTAAHVDVFQRTPPWLGPTPNYHDPVTAGKQWALEHVPFYEKWYRFWLFWTLTDGVLDGVRVEPGYNGPPTAVGEVNAALREMLVMKIAEQLQDRPALLDKVIPQYPFGGKRSVRDNGVWLAALKRDNVDLITSGIEKITPKGIVTADGVEHPADILIYGTGFKASQFLSTYKVYGKGGVELHDKWAGDARAYLGMTVPDFPNFFMIYGPNTNIVVNGSIIFFSECSVRYIVGALEMMADKDIAALEVKPAVHDAFNAKVDAGNAAMAWGSPQVNSWYKNALGRVSQNWPFLLVDYWEATLKPDPKDFEVTVKREAVGA